MRGLCFLCGEGHSWTGVYVLVDLTKKSMPA